VLLVLLLEDDLLFRTRFFFKRSTERDLLLRLLFLEERSLWSSFAGVGLLRRRVFVPDFLCFSVSLLRLRSLGSLLSLRRFVLERDCERFLGRVWRLFLIDDCLRDLDLERFLELRLVRLRVRCLARLCDLDLDRLRAFDLDLLPLSFRPLERLFFNFLDLDRVFLLADFDLLFLSLDSLIFSTVVDLSDSPLVPLLEDEDDDEDDDDEDDRSFSFGAEVCSFASGGLFVSRGSSLFATVGNSFKELSSLAGLSFLAGLSILAGLSAFVGLSSLPGLISSFSITSGEGSSFGIGALDFGSSFGLGLLVFSFEGVSDGNTSFCKLVSLGALHSPESFCRA